MFICERCARSNWGGNACDRVKCECDKKKLQLVILLSSSSPSYIYTRPSSVRSRFQYWKKTIAYSFQPDIQACGPANNNNTL